MKRLTLDLDLDPDICQQAAAQHASRPTHCDACAEDLPRAYVSALLYDQSVVVCSGRCLAALQRVWTPTRREHVGWRVIGAVAMILMYTLWR